MPSKRLCILNHSRLRKLYNKTIIFIEQLILTKGAATVNNSFLF
jgi:hypothetical protein